MHKLMSTEPRELQSKQVFKLFNTKSKRPGSKWLSLMKENSLKLNDHWPDASTYPAPKRVESQSNYAIRPRKRIKPLRNAPNIRVSESTTPPLDALSGEACASMGY